MMKNDLNSARESRLLGSRVKAADSVFLAVGKPTRSFRAPPEKTRILIRPTKKLQKKRKWTHSSRIYQLINGLYASTGLQPFPFWKNPIPNQRFAADAPRYLCVSSSLSRCHLTLLRLRACVPSPAPAASVCGRWSCDIDQKANPLISLPSLILRDHQG